jgi:phosphate starvation-inducible protein PhoH
LIIERESPTTKFLNVDLDIYSKSSLQPLIDALGKKVHVLHTDRVGRSHRAFLEVSGMTKTMDVTIRKFCKLITALPPAQRRTWKKATRRDFNIGIQSGMKGETFLIEAETVKAAAALGARIVMTIYGATIREMTAGETPTATSD